MKNESRYWSKVKKYLLYGGIEKADYDQVQTPVGEANHKALTYWSVLVSFFWIYCLLMSLKAPDYARCRTAYAVALAICVFSYCSSQFLVKRFPKTLFLFKFIFRLSLLGGGIGIAVCQWDLRSLTLFAVAIISPSIFVDSTLSSLAVHISALVLYIALGRNVIAPEIYSWGLGNYILFSIFGLLIGNAINKERYERYVYAEAEKQLADMQKRYAYNDPLTGLKNRRAYEEKLLQLNVSSEFCLIMADINGLKDTNDTIGHEAGDELIIGASECLRGAFEEIDSIYRIGGDEFCIVMSGSTDKAQRCLSQLEELLRRWKGRYINGISISAGVASSREQNDIKAIAAQADRNMYESKRTYYQNRGFDRRRR
ncbi:MAG: GGDEF domain-containing protein [Oscillospiraceae bacterium]|nr:GGDEF domain-containing protein [Oscillospiraceae bacterium]